MAITLTTDFGLGSAYVAAMKGVILSINPDVALVDLSHGIGPQDVFQASLLLGEATPWFPAGTIHVAVVDPGVGTSRHALYALLGDQQFVVPDNGLLTHAAARTPPTKLIALDRSEYWLPHVSNTFHGRDLFAPVAARLSLGLPAEELGSPVTDFVRLRRPAVDIGERRLQGEVQHVDCFGNLITNLSADMLNSSNESGEMICECGGAVLHGLARTYGDFAPGTLIALIGSSGYLELAVTQGSAALKLGLGVGTPVTVRW